MSRSEEARAVNRAARGSPGAVPRKVPEASEGRGAALEWETAP